MKKNILRLMTAGIICLSFTTTTLAETKAAPKKTNIGGMSILYHGPEGNGEIGFSNGKAEAVDGNYRALFIDGNAIDGATIITRDNRTLVPIRIISEALGAKVGWDDSTRQVTIDKDNLKIEMIIGSAGVSINQSPKTLDTAPIIHNNRTYLPLRFVSENLGTEVNYYDNSNDGTLGIITRVPNVTVDPKYGEDVKAITKKAAVEKVTKTLSDSLELHKKNILPENLAIIEPSLENVSVLYEASRYYVLSGLEGIYDIIFDKYTGDMYKRTYVQIQTIKEFDPEDISNFSLAG